jgi:hypothetical protein
MNTSTHSVRHHSAPHGNVALDLEGAKALREPVVKRVCVCVWGGGGAVSGG